MYYKNSQSRNPSNFFVQFLEIDDFINSFWLNLTFSGDKKLLGMILMSQSLARQIHNYNKL